MKTNDLIDSLGRIDDGMILRTDMLRKGANRKTAWVKWAALAACVCIAAGIGCLRYEKAMHPWPIETVPALPVEEPSTAEIPRWEDMKIYEKYSSFPFNGREYGARSGVVPEERLGEKLGDVTACGWDEYADLNGEDALRTLEAEVFAITEISPEYAVAVRFAGTESCYAAVNSSMRPHTLGEFMNALNLQSELQFGYIWYEYKRPNGEIAFIRFENAEREKILEMLLSAPEAENVFSEQDFYTEKKLLDISVDVPLFGYKNISIALFEGGWVQTNILETGKRFCIGEENTQAFIEYVIKQCEGYEIRYDKEGESSEE